MSHEIPKSPENNPTGISWAWQIFKDLLPVVTVVLTAILTLIVWFTQQTIEHKVDNNQLLLQAQLQTQQTQLQAQLALDEEFYKRRLTIYETACQKIANAQTSLANVGKPDETSDESRIQAGDFVDELDKLRRGYQLYWSTPVDEYLDKLWNLGICRLGSRPCEIDGGGVLEVDALPQEITKAVAVLHKQMKIDLNILERAKALQEASKPSQETK